MKGSAPRENFLSEKRQCEAGKSTLLKLLSRVTSPSEGRIQLRGRVGSLLEVGRAEIARKLDPNLKDAV